MAKEGGAALFRQLAVPPELQAVLERSAPSSTEPATGSRSTSSPTQRPKNDAARTYSIHKLPELARRDMR